ncbi:MAG: TIGR02301 family protein [Hyphomicrobiales bacterium]|nr:TIGR02301 family protein [Hyphomicrobiales bacterium]
MTNRNLRHRRLACALFALLLCLVWADPLAAQNRQRRQAPPPAAQPAAPARVLPAPSPDDRPYDDKLLRLSEILGAIHYLRELCGADEGQLWRQQMKEIIKAEGTTAIRRAKLVKEFNKGYRGFRRTYRSCTRSAKVAIGRFLEEGEQISKAMLAEGR